MKMKTNTLLLIAGAGVGGWFLWQHMQRQQRPVAPAPIVGRPVPPGAPGPWQPPPLPPFGVQNPFLPPARPPLFQPNPGLRRDQWVMPPNIFDQRGLIRHTGMPRPVGGDFDFEGHPDDPYGSQGAVLQ